MKRDKISTVLITIFLTSVVCTLIFFAYKDWKDKVQEVWFEGTYEIIINGEKEYITIIPDDEETEYQWCTAEGNLLLKGNCKLKEHKYITLRKANKNVGTIFEGNGQYFYINDTGNVKSISKIDNEALIISSSEE